MSPTRAPTEAGPKEQSVQLIFETAARMTLWQKLTVMTIKKMMRMDQWV
jgi:hypothetical protein